MPDISKCRGGTCPLRDKCYRFTSPASDFRQSWLPVIPYGKVEPNSCNFFSPNSLEEAREAQLET